MNGTEAEIAWAAGLFEGEGCMTPKAKTAVSLHLAMTDFDTVETFARITDAGRLTVTPRLHPKRQTQLTWELTTAPEIRDVLAAFVPWFHARRRAKAKEMLERLENNRGAAALRTHCLRGHPYSGDNLYITKEDPPRRRCRACWRYEYHQRRAAA